jgi:hypothetical protein
MAGGFAAGAGPQDRRHLTAQQRPAARRRNEVRRRFGAALAQALLDVFQRVGDLAAFEDGKDRPPQSDQRAAAHRRRPLRQGLELQACAAVVEQDAAVEVADHHAQRELGHQRGEPVLLLLDRGLGDADLRLDVVEQFVALLGQVVGGAGQVAHLGRPLGRDAEVAVGAKHQAQGFGHAQEAMHVLLEQGAQQLQAEDQGHDGHQAADRQPAVHGDEKAGALLGAEVDPEDAHGQQERPGHQQAEHGHGERETRLGVHASSVLIRATRSLVEKGLVM